MTELEDLQARYDACVVQRSEFQARVNRLEGEVREWATRAIRSYGIEDGAIRDLLTACGIDVVVQRNFTISSTFSGTVEVSLIDVEGIDFEDVLDVNVDQYNLVSSMTDKVDVIHAWFEIDDVSMEDA